jgi:hypothetical protein
MPRISRVIHGMARTSPSAIEVHRFGTKQRTIRWSKAMADPATLVKGYLLYFILPLWIAAGLTDYVLHRRTQIAHTSGTKESLLHLLQLSEAGLPVLMGLLLEINALVLLLMLVALAAHQVTALWDARYAITRRYVGPLEQHVHSFLELLPLMGVSFVTILYWDQFLALFGLGMEVPRFKLQLKDPPLPLGYLLGLFTAILLFVVLPYIEELRRCLAVSRVRERRAANLRRAA